MWPPRATPVRQASCHGGCHVLSAAPQLLSLCLAHGARAHTYTYIVATLRPSPPPPLFFCAAEPVVDMRVRISRVAHLETARRDSYRHGVGLRRSTVSPLVVVECAGVTATTTVLFDTVRPALDFFYVQVDRLPVALMPALVVPILFLLFSSP